MASSWLKQNVTSRFTNGGRQAQAQTFVNNQKQKTVQTQTFIQQVDDAIQCVSLAAESYLAGINDKTVNLVCDGAVISLNMLAVSCDQLDDENDQDTLDLGRKRAEDKLSELKSKNIKVYQLVEPHRNFIDATLNGERNLRYKSNRVKPAVQSLFQNPDKVNKGWGTLIQHNQNFDRRQEAMLEPGLNQKLAKEHQSELNKYRNDGKYRSKSSHKSSRAGSKRSKAKVTDLYFTKSGKESKFVDTRAVEHAQNEEKAMDQDVYGPEPDIYDELLKRPFMNAVLLLSPQTSWNNIGAPIPCQILVPSKDQRAKQNKNEVKILPCYPNNNCTLNATLDILELRVDEIKKIEDQYIKNLRKYSANVPNPALGYKSIAEQDNIDVDIDMK